MIQIGVAGKFYTIPKRSIQVSAAESAAVGLEALHKLNGISLKIFNHKEYQQFRLHACASAWKNNNNKNDNTGCNKALSNTFIASSALP